MLTLYNYILSLFRLVDDADDKVKSFIKYDPYLSAWKVYVTPFNDIDPLIYEVIFIDDFEHEEDAHIMALKIRRKALKEGIVWRKVYGNQ